MSNTKNFEIDGIVAKPGEKAFGFINVGDTSVNTYKIPVAIINGAEKGKTLCILGGVHGTEFAGIEAVIRTIQNLNPKKMSGAVIAVPVVNGPQFEHRTAALSPFDQLNQNRQFPGNPEGTLSQRTAHIVLTRILSKADALCDCHGGDISEDIAEYAIATQTGNEELNRISIEMAKCFPGKVTLFSNARYVALPGTTCIAQDVYKIPCVTAESSVPYPVRELDIKYHYEGIQNIMKYLGILAGKPTMYDTVVNPETYRPAAKHGGIWTSNVEVRQMVEKGQELGKITDLFGNVLETFNSQKRGIVIYKRAWYSVNYGESLIEVAHL